MHCALPVEDDSQRRPSHRNDPFCLDSNPPGVCGSGGAAPAKRCSSHRHAGSRLSSVSASQSRRRLPRSGSALDWSGERQSVSHHPSVGFQAEASCQQMRRPEKLCAAMRAKRAPISAS